jgi:hypothetical protein
VSSFGEQLWAVSVSGIIPSVPDLIAAIEDYLRVNNADPKPFMWTASAESILEKVRRGRVALEAARQN